jgi:hypothetical protein
MRTHIVFYIACTVSAILLTHCTQPTQSTEDNVRRALLASRWHLDTTSSAEYKGYKLCTGIGITTMELDFISATHVVRKGRNGTIETRTWLLHQPSYYLHGQLELQVGDSKFPITYCNRDTLILGTPWLDADCNGFRMLAQAK